MGNILDNKLNWVSENAGHIRDSLYKSARRIVGEAEAEDAVQEAFLRIWTKIDFFDEDRPFLPWARVILLNVIRDKKRSQRRKNEVRFPDFYNNSSYVNPLDEMIIEEDSLYISDNLSKLPSIYGDVVRASYFEEKSHREISHEQSIPIGTVKSRKTRGVELLKSTLVTKFS